jgi:hypothetical protein
MMQLEFSFILSRKSMFLLCLKNPLSANYDVGQNVQSVRIAVGEKFRRSKLPSVKNSVGQNCRRSKLPSVKNSVGQNCRRSKLPSVKIVIGQNCRRSKWPSVKAASVKRPGTLKTAKITSIQISSNKVRQRHVTDEKKSLFKLASYEI